MVADGFFWRVIGCSRGVGKRGVCFMGVSRRADSCRCCREIGRAGGMIFSFMPFNM